MRDSGAGSLWLLFGNDGPFTLFGDADQFPFFGKFHPFFKKLFSVIAELFLKGLGQPAKVEVAFAVFEGGAAFVAEFGSCGVDCAAGGTDIEEAETVYCSFADPFLRGHAFDLCGGLDLGLQGARQADEDLFIVSFGAVHNVLDVGVRIITSL